MQSDKYYTLELIKQISGQQNVLTIPRVYLDMLDGDIKTALFLSQVIYWSDKGGRGDGWFYKTDKEWKDELSLSEYECKKARDKLSQEGVLLLDKKKANGVPTMHYKVDWDNLSKWVIKKFSNREEMVDEKDSVSEKFEEGSLKNSETRSQKTPKSLTEITNIDYYKEKNKDTDFPSNIPKGNKLFDLPSKPTNTLNPLKVLEALKGKSKLTKKLQFVVSGELGPEHLNDLDLCFYFAQKHKEIVGYEIPYQKEQHMATWRGKYELTVTEAFNLLPKIAETFRKICEEDKRKKSEWFLKIGWFIFDSPSDDIVRVMNKVKPKVNEKYVTKEEEVVPNRPHEIVDEIF
jgi:hypothetical protein